MIQDYGNYAQGGSEDGSPSPWALGDDVACDFLNVGNCLVTCQAVSVDIWVRVAIPRWRRREKERLGEVRDLEKDSRFHKWCVVREGVVVY